MHTLILRSCHAFSHCFCTYWWNPTKNHFFSSSSSCASRFSKALQSAMPVIIAIRKLGTMYSMGMTASLPYTNWKGFWPVNFLHVVQYAHSTAGMGKSQSFHCALQTLVNAVSKILLNASIVPFTCRWYGVLCWWYIWNSSVSALIVSFRNSFPRSLIIILGHPNRVNTF